MMEEKNLQNIISQFKTEGEIKEISPLGNGLINETFIVKTVAIHTPNYVLQRINNAVFQDVDLLQHNIEVVTGHIRRKLLAKGEQDIDRKCLRFVPTADGKTYYKDAANKYWRVSIFIDNSVTKESVTPESAYDCGRTFGNFEYMLSDIKEPLGETIPNFHNIELRVRQLQEAVQADKVGRVREVSDVINTLMNDADAMCLSEKLHRQGALPKRICHCDTKVNNMLFDQSGEVLCVIDLDTVMPSYVFSDYGDFLRTSANFVAEDCPEIQAVGLNEDIFKAFTEGYLSTASAFLIETEVKNLPYAAALFPYMQCVRFLADYLNGDSYYKINYPEHNLIRTQNQLALYKDVVAHNGMMTDFIKRFL